MAPVVDLIAGMCGGVACTVVGHPLDSVKVLMQTQSFNNYASAHARGANPLGLTSVLRTFKSVLHTQGWRTGLYAGVTPAVYSSAAENACLFLFYGRISSMIDSQERFELSPFARGAAAGACAAILNSLVLCPTELMKCRMQVGVRASVSELAVGILKSEGLRGFYQALAPTVLREVPGNFAFFGVYEGVRSLSIRLFPERKKLAAFVSGGLGGVAFWVVALPADTVKSAMQVQSNRTIVETVRLIYRGNGMAGFFGGLSAVVIRAFPANAALLVTYDVTKEALLGFSGHVSSLTQTSK